jgi:hypothetical protein
MRGEAMKISSMQISRMVLGAALFLALTGLPENPAVRPAHGGESLADGGRKVGQGFKEMGKATGKAAKEGGVAVGKAFKKAGVATGKAFKEAGKNVKEAVTGNR